MKWLKELIFSKYFRSLVRGAMKFLAGFLVAKGLTTPEMAGEMTAGIGQFLTSPEVMEFLGALLFSGAQLDSWKDKKSGAK